MKAHIVIDQTTGQIKARGRSGRWYTQHEIDQAYDPADPQGAIYKEDIDRSDLTDSDMREALTAEMHDCPECRAALAAGIQPTFGTGEELMKLMKLMDAMELSAAPRKKPSRRWRDQRRGR